jgi:hypothetical protein
MGLGYQKIRKVKRNIFNNIVPNSKKLCFNPKEMSKIVLYVFISVIYVFNIFPRSPQTCRLIVYADQLAGQQLKIGYYHGLKTFMLDSVHFTDQGFASTTDLRHAGIFLLVWPDGTHNEIMADCETEIIIKIEQTYPFKVSIQGNVVAEGYEVYLETLRKITTARDSIGKLIDITADNDKKSDMRKEQTLLDKELDYQITFMAERYKGTLLGNYLRYFSAGRYQ